jgi:hypothetical protein
MPESKKRPKPIVVEEEIRTFNPTKSKFGKVLLIILAVGFVLSIIVAAVAGMISVLA